MSDRKPLVLGDDMQLQQLQSTDNLDIPLEEQVKVMQYKFRTLCHWLVSQGIQMPDELRD